MARALSHDDRIRLSSMIMEIFDTWGVTSEQRIILLGMPEGTRSRELRRLQGGAPFPDDETTMARAEQLLAIHDCLRTAYPRNASMADYWLHQTNRHFGRKAPLQLMLENGAAGLQQVRTHLDCTQNWI